MPSTGPKQSVLLSPRNPAYLPRALFVTLGLFLAVSLLTVSCSPMGSRLAGVQLLEKLLDQKQFFFRLLFASRAFSLDLALALASHLLRRTRSVVQVRVPLLLRDELRDPLLLGRSAWFHRPASEGLAPVRQAPPGGPLTLQGQAFTMAAAAERHMSRNVCVSSQTPEVYGGKKASSRNIPACTRTPSGVMNALNSKSPLHT
jgi:hypothetical protein